MSGQLIVLNAYRTSRQRTTETPERLPLAMTAHQGAVSIVVGDETELWVGCEQLAELIDDLTGLLADARALQGGAR